MSYTEMHKLEPVNGRIVTGVVTVTTGLTGMDVYTGMGMVTGVAICMKASSAATTGVATYNETLPLSGQSAVSFVCTSGMVFSYIITGY